MEQAVFLYLATFVALFSLVPSTTLAPNTTDDYYDEDDLVHELEGVSPITDSPVPADQLPSGSNTSVVGNECIITR